MQKTSLFMLSALAMAGVGQAALAFQKLPAPAHVVQVAHVPDQITMDEKSGEYTLSWRQMPDKIVIRWKLMAIDDEIIVCGNYALVGHSGRKLSRQALDDTSVMMDGRPLVPHVSVFNEVRRAGQLVGSKATCVRSGVAAPEDPRAHDFSIGDPKSVYYD